MELQAKKPRLVQNINLEDTNWTDPCDSTFEPKIELVLPLEDLPPEPYLGDSTFEPKIELVLPLEDLPPEPYQPEIVPPYRDKRRPHLFQQKWYKEYPWLHFDPTTQMMFCHQCLLAINKNYIEAPSNNIFARGGFRNWKKGVERFRVHENSQLHKDTYEFSVEKRQILIQTFHGIQTTVDCMKYLISQKVFLKNGSLSQLLDLRKEELPLMDDLLKKIQLSPDIEKELVSIMAACILRTLCCRIRSFGEFALIVDKVNTPIGEMLSLSVRTVNQFNADHLFLGLYVEQSIYKDLPKFLDFENLKYHSFNFINTDNILKNEIHKLQPKSLCLPSWNMNINLAIQENLINEKGIGNCIYIVKELQKILKNTNFCDIFTNESEFDKTWICSKRKYINFKTISGILNSYKDIIDYLKEMSENSCSFLASCLKEKMSESETCFYFLMCKVLVYPVENLSNITEKAKSAQGVKEAAESVIKILTSYKEKKDFDILWKKFISISSSLKLTNKETNEKDMIEKYKFIYYKSIDLFIKYINQLFKNEEFDILLNLECALFNDNEEFDENTKNILETFDIPFDTFLMEKSMLKNTLESDLTKMDLDDLSSKLQTLKTETINLFPLINKIIYLLTLAPISPIHEERDFTRARSMITFLSNYKSEEMVSDVCVCFVYKDEPGILNSSEVAKEYIEIDPNMKSVVLLKS